MAVVEVTLSLFARRELVSNCYSFLGFSSAPSVDFHFDLVLEEPVCLCSRSENCSCFHAHDKKLGYDDSSERENEKL